MKAYNIRCRLGNLLFQFAHIYSDVTAKGGYDYSVNVCPIPLDRLKYKPTIAEGGEFLGWMESEQFFTPEIIRPIYRPTKELVAAIHAKYGDLSNSLFIHVRRGDFYSLRNKFVVLKGSYYEDMYARLAANKTYTRVFVASDDFDWCKENIHLQQDVTYLEDESAFDTIMVAAMCKDFIISASTFSWWCAWLGETNHGRIIHPHKQFRDGFNQEWGDKFFPDRWEAVDASPYYEDAPYKILLCAIAKMENHYIREWVEHYKRLGFDNICLYDNNEVEGERFEDVISDYIDEGFVILKDVRGLTEQQHPCYMNCYKEFGNDYNWIAFFDVDEFLELEDKTMNIKTFLNQNKFIDYNCVRICWRNYTDSGLVHVENSNYSIMRFSEWVPSRCCKSIIRTGLKLKIIKAHGGTPVIPCNAGGKSCWNDLKPSFAKIGTKPYYKHAWLNHYRCKTIEEYVRFKLFRLYPDQSQEKAKKELTLDFFFTDNKWTKEKKQVAKEIFKEMDLYNKGYQLYW